jgi:hypothetical protein
LRRNQQQNNSSLRSIEETGGVGICTDAKVQTTIPLSYYIAILDFKRVILFDAICSVATLTTLPCQFSAFFAGSDAIGVRSSYRNILGIALLVAGRELKAGIWWWGFIALLLRAFFSDYRSAPVAHLELATASGESSDFGEPKS